MVCDEWYLQNHAEGPHIIMGAWPPAAECGVGMNGLHECTLHHRHGVMLSILHANDTTL